VREARARHAEDKAAEAEAKAQAAQLQAEEAETRAREAETRAQQLQAQVNTLHSQLRDVYASTSWKISAPLRKVGRVIIVGNNLARQASASPRAFARQTLRSLVHRAVPLVRRSPYLMESAWRIYSRFPVLGERMLRHARSSGSSALADHSQGLSAISDVPSAWTQSGSPSGHFKTMLSREIQRRHAERL
jgi:O-antigen chain-terminating methyltransferase